MLTMLARLLKALNSESGAWAIAVALVLGMIIGLTPLWRLHNLLILFIALVFRVNLSAFLLSFMLCSGFAYLLDPWFHQWGVTILSAEAWQPIWQAWYQSPVGRLSQFHHSITMGSWVFALLLALPLLFLSYGLVKQYRRQIQARVNRLHVVQMLKASKFWSAYETLRG